MSDMTIIQLTEQQYRYIAQCVAYGLNCFGPWPNREQEEKKFSRMFNLVQDKYQSWETCFHDEEEDE